MTFKDPIQSAYERSRKQWPDLCADFARFKNRALAAGIPPKKMALEDLFLAVAIEERDPKAWEIFYRQYEAYIRRICRRVTGNPDLAGDICQQYMSEIPERIKKYKGIGSLYGWLTSLIPYYCIDHLRKIRHTDPVEEDACLSVGSAALDHVDVPFCKKMLTDLFKAALKHLSADEQLVIQCRYIDGLTNREIAAFHLKTREHTASRRHSDAVAVVRKHFLKQAAAHAKNGLADLHHCLDLLTKIPHHFQLLDIIQKILKNPSRNP